MIKNDSRLASIALSALLGLAAPSVFAQASGAEQQGQPPASQQQPAAEPQEFEDQEVEQFAQSFSEIMNIREEFTAELEQAEDAEQAQKLQNDANEQMIEAIESNGMTVQDYNAMVQAMQADPDFRSRVVEMID